MNQIYKLIWNVSRQVWIAVGEFTKSRGKSHCASSRSSSVPSRHPSLRMHALFLALSFSYGGGVLAVEWNVPIGEWSEGSNWQGGVTPGASDEASIDNSGTAQVTSGTVDTAEIYVGNLVDGSLAISNGGAVNNDVGYIGRLAGSTGSVTVAGAGSSWTNSGNFYVGNSGSGSLAISDGGAVSNLHGYIGLSSGITGSVTVDGTGSSWTNSGNFYVGNSGTGSLAIRNGGTVSNALGNIGFISSGNGSVTVDGTGSSWTNSNNLNVGFYGTGALTISDSGQVEVNSGAGTVTIANEVGSTGTLNIGAASGDAAVAAGTLNTATVTFGGGTGSLVFNHTDTDYTFAPGITGVGTLNHHSGGTSLTGDSSGFTGDTNITGGTLRVTGTGSLGGAIILDGGSFNVMNGGTFGGTNAYIGKLAGTTGAVTVDGAGSTWTNSSDLYVGASGTGSLTISNGGVVNGHYNRIGDQFGSFGSVTVDGVGSSWENTQAMFIGFNGSGSLAISNGGKVSNTFSSIAYRSNTSGVSTGSVTVDGSGSSWTNSSDLIVGDLGNGSLTISNGGAVSNTFSRIADGIDTIGTVTVDGMNSIWTNSDTLVVGDRGIGSLTVSNGGTVSNTSSRIGYSSSSTGTVTVDGAGSTWTNSSDLTVGYQGSGALTISNGGAVSASNIFISNQVQSTGTLNIGAAEGDNAVAAGSLTASTITFVDGIGSLVFNHTESAYDFAPTITGTGTVSLLSGATRFSANAGDLTGYTGTMFVDGGTLSVYAGQSMQVGGDYTQTVDGTLRIGVTDDTTYGKLVVSGTATLPSNAKIDIDVSNPNFSFTTAVTNGMAGVLSATNLVSDGTFTVTDNSALFNFSAVKNEDAVDLTLASLPPPPPPPPPPAAPPPAEPTPAEPTPAEPTPVEPTPAEPTPAEPTPVEPPPVDPTPLFNSIEQIVVAEGNLPGAGAGRVFDGVINHFIQTGEAGAFASVIDTFARLNSEDEVNRAVNQTLPLLTGGSQMAATSALTGMSRVVQSRIDSNRGLSSGDYFYGDETFWLKPFGSWADQDDRKGVSGYESNTAGLAFGGDTTVSDTTRLGLSFAYASSSVDGNSTLAPNSAKVDVYQMIGYGSHALDDVTEFNFQLGIGQNRNKGVRDLSSFGVRATSSYDSLVATAGAGVGRNVSLREVTTFTPSIRADYSWIRDEGYTETGAGPLNLKINSRTMDELIIALDGKLTQELKQGVSLSANLGLGYDVLNAQTSMTSSFAGAPGAAFTTKGIDPSPWLARGGLGIVSHTAGGMAISARYDAEYRQDFLNQTASIKLRWVF